MRYVLMLCILLSVFGCNKKTSDATTETLTEEAKKNQSIPSTVPSTNPTDIVKAIADFGRVESSHVGFAGTPSVQHNRFIDMRDNVQESKLIELLKHESRVVKYYAFRALRENGNTNIKTYYKQMVDDQGMVNIMNGCIMSEVDFPSLLKQEMVKGNIRSERAERRVSNNSNQ